MSDWKNRLALVAILGLTVTSVACGDVNPEDDDHDHDHDHEQEVFTTLTLTLTPQGGGDAVTATFRDADGEGGEAPTVDAPTLAANTTYDVTVTLLNETVDQDDEEYEIGNEIKAEAEEHQLFYTGSGVDSGLLTWMYGDVESDYGDNTGDDLPVGLAGTLATGDAGSGQLTVTLKHQPPVNDTAVKSATSTIQDGETDIEVTYDVTVE